MNLKIKKGEMWAKPLFNRLKYNRFTGITIDQSLHWKCAVDMSKCPTGTSIKLVGASEFWPLSFNRVRNNGWGDILNVAHEESDRIVCIKRGDGTLALNAYAYRNGVGAVSPKEIRDRHPEDLNQRIAIVENNQKFHVKMIVCNEYTKYMITNCNPCFNIRQDEILGITHISRDYPCSWFRFWAFAHAAGAHGPVAPEQINLTIENLS